MSRSVRVRLTMYEFTQAAIIGCLRRVSAIDKGRIEVRGKVSDPWGVDIEAGCAELAVAKYMDRWWHALNDPKTPSPDVGERASKLSAVPRQTAKGVEI